MQSIYRTLVTISLAGLDTVPSERLGAAWSRSCSSSPGVTIFAYIATRSSRGSREASFTGALAERRRRRTIEQLTRPLHHLRLRTRRPQHRRRVPRGAASSSSCSTSAPRRSRPPGSGTALRRGQTAPRTRISRRPGFAARDGLVASSDSDADNLYITLSARDARPDLLIVARASDEAAAKKLRLAGADRVVQPYSTAGKEMAKLVAEAAGGRLPRRRLDARPAPSCGSRRSRSSAACGQAGKTIRELRIRERPAR